MPTLTSESREAIADILETIAQDGFPGPRDLDVALDAIESSIDFELEGAAPVAIDNEPKPFDTAALVAFYGHDLKS